MNTVIVPVDFSPTSLNAAKYAASLLAGHYGINMLLYHCYHDPSEEAEATEHLKLLKETLMKEHIIKMDILVHHSSNFVDGLEKAARHRRADLVIMGITGKSSIKNVFLGSNTIKMVETKACPVLIVPEKAVFGQMKNVMLTSDFKNTIESIPTVPIKDFLDVFRPKLHILNVDKEHYISLTGGYEEEKKQLNQLFLDYHPEFYFMRLFDLEEALQLFAEDCNIDLIMLIHKNHTFLEKVFTRSHAKSLAYTSEVPLLVVHE